MLHLILGSMYSGKTSELIRLLTRAKIANKKVVLLRPETDNRPNLTHSRLTHDIEEVFVSSLSDVNWKNYDVIGVDEGQFFDENLVKQADHIASTKRKVIISALNGTSERGPFGVIQSLIPLVDDITFEHAVCTDCGSEFASCSFYKLGSKTESVIVGGENEYTALCRDCYNTRLSLEKENKIV